MRLHDLLAGLAESDGAELPEVRGEPGVGISSVVHDSREASAGSLFCCIRGSRYDGHSIGGCTPSGHMNTPKRLGSAAPSA